MNIMDFFKISLETLEEIFDCGCRDFYGNDFIFIMLESNCYL